MIMGISSGYKVLALFLVVSILVTSSEQRRASESNVVLRIQHLLHLPNPRLSKNATDFCSSESGSSSVSVVCYGKTITQLHIIGNTTTQLPDNFSVESLVSTLVKLAGLKVLKLVSLGIWGALPENISRLSSLEILDLSSNSLYGPLPEGMLSITSLQDLIVDGNKFSGSFPQGLSLLSSLMVLSAKNNSLSGSLPDSLRSLVSLRVLALSNNSFSGAMPDLSGLVNLQVLDLENNALGPRFPQVGSKIVSLVLRKNKFSYGIPDQLRSCYQLEHLDVSSNNFVGPFPSYLLPMPSVSYLDIAENRFTGKLFEDLSCNGVLKFVNLSGNLLTGKLPNCLLSSSSSGSMTVQYGGNCLTAGDEPQKPYSYCQTGALAVGILPHHKRQKRVSKLVIPLSVLGSLIGAIVLILLVFVLVTKCLTTKSIQEKPRVIKENVSAAHTSKLLSDARYVTQAMKLGSLGLPAYRTFSLAELEEATNNFHTSTYRDKGSHNQVYIGRLNDASRVAIRCLKMKKRKSAQNLMHHIELVSKLRHQNLVSSLGHCFEFYLDDSSVSRIFLIFEYVPNGSLRSWISDRHSPRKLNWAQRISAAIGVAKGIQFLHGGIVPGIFPNHLKITDVLLDQNLVSKVNSYNLPLLAECMEKETSDSSAPSTEFRRTRIKHQEKLDIYDFGVILLEIITGKAINSKNEETILKDQLQASTTADEVSRKRVADPAVTAVCSDESLKTVIEICCKCLVMNPVDRPSVEDILWNLQFAAQVQDGWRGGESNSSDASPVTVAYFQSPHLRLTVPHC